MDSEKPHTCKFIPEIGRGCAFADGGNEAEARPCDGCFKLHETPWLEGYPENIPTDIFEVRFRNTRGRPGGQADAPHGLQPLQRRV